MNKVILIALVILASASLVFAQSGGGIIISSDTQGVDCNLYDMVPGLCSYYIVHIAIPGSVTGATASQFSAPKPACLLATWLSDTNIFPVTVGNSQNGVAIGYGTCWNLPVHVLTMNYFCQGLTGSCCEYRPAPDPNVPSGKIEVVDCAGGLLYGVSICAMINPDASCPCWATPTEDSTWGKVKSLYAE